jgi:hypothetical protein
VEGPPDIMAELDPSAVVPFVRVRQLPPVEGNEVTVDVDLPRGCKALKVEPKSVKVYREGARKQPSARKPIKGVQKAR